METLFFGFGALIAFVLLLAIAEPYRFLPDFEQKAKSVGSTYWGIYEGASVEEKDPTQKIKLHKVARKERYVAGSSTYANGRGVNMSGRG